MSAIALTPTARVAEDSSVTQVVNDLMVALKARQEDDSGFACRALIELSGRTKNVLARGFGMHMPQPREEFLREELKPYQEMLLQHAQKQWNCAVTELHDKVRGEEDRQRTYYRNAYGEL